MKTKNVFLFALLPLGCLLLVSCDNFSSNQNSSSPFLSPKELQVHTNDQGEKEIKLDFVDTNTWVNPELQALEEKIRESRKQRVEVRLEALKEERLYFSSPILTLKNSGHKEVTLDVTFKNKNHKIVFSSPKNHSKDFYFEKIGGFDQRAVRLQGMCLDDDDNCRQLAVEISYIYKKVRITEQFIMNSALDQNYSKIDSTEEGNISVDVVDDDIPDPSLTVENEEDIDLSPQPEVKGTMDVVLTPPNVDSTSPSMSLTPGSSDNLGASRTAPNRPTVGKTDDLEIDIAATEPSSASKVEPAPIQNTKIKSGDDPSSPIEVTDNIELTLSPLDTNNKAVSSDTLNSTKEDSVKVSRTTPVMPPPVKLNEPAIDTIATQNPPAPSIQKNEVIEINIDDENKNSGPDHSTGNEDLVLGAGQIIFPDITIIDEEDLVLDLEEEFNVNTGESKTVSAVSSSLRPVARPINDAGKGSRALVANIKNKIFNQSRGYYGAHAVRGRIKDSTQMPSTTRGAIVNPARRSKQYGSGMMTSVLKHSADRLHSKYPDSPLCINNIAEQHGGKFGKHASHRNGLDADVSFPSSTNKCKGSFFYSWKDMSGRDRKFMEKNWFYLNELINTERVFIIFASKYFTKALCSYVKSNTSLSKTERNKVFRYLHHADGHHNHYHIRLQCNDQNPGCVTQDPRPNGSTCK